MYDTNVYCIYHKEDIFLDSDNLTLEQKDKIREDIYRNDLLNIFQLEEYNDELLGRALDDLYDKISTSDILIQYIIKLMEIYYGFSQDPKFGIIFLFTYENMYLFHPCIIDYLLHKEIRDENLSVLKSELF
jgi:hypothetical protein